MTRYLPTWVESSAISGGNSALNRVLVVDFQGRSSTEDLREAKKSRIPTIRFGIFHGRAARCAPSNTADAWVVVVVVEHYWPTMNQ